MNPVTVVIADDQPLMRAGFRVVLEASDITVLAEAADGVAAVREVREHNPDVVLMDIRMPAMDGIEATRNLPQAKVLILTVFGYEEYIIEALRAGASGFLLKDAPTEEVVDAVRAVAAGEAVLSASVTRRLLDQVARRLPPPCTQAPAELQQLSDREREVLQLIASGLTNTEIAAALFLSEATVKSHVSHLLSKLHLRNRVQAVIYAYDAGLVAPKR